MVSSLSVSVPTSSRRRSRPLWVALTSLVGACIIPDSGIQLEIQRSNPGAVRLVQPVAISAEALAACENDAGVCPVPDRTLPFGLISSAVDRPFCRCPSNQRDLNALYQFDIFVEDPDVDPQDERDPIDTLLGALILDPDPNNGPAVAYENYLPTSQAARLVQGNPAYDEAIERPPPNLKAWTLGIESPVDLCNNNNGVAVAPGLHTIQVVVTDRPWYVPVSEREEDGVSLPEVQGNTFVREINEDPIAGVPDLPGGATFDTATYVFECLDSAESDLCNCSQPT